MPATKQQLENRRKHKLIINEILDCMAFLTVMAMIIAVYVLVPQ